MESEAVARVHKAILRADGGTVGQARAAIAELFDWLESKEFISGWMTSVQGQPNPGNYKFIRYARKEALGE